MNRERLTFPFVQELLVPLASWLQLGILVPDSIRLIAIKLAHVKPDASSAFIGIPIADNLLDKRHDFRHVFGHASDSIGRKNMKTVHVRQELVFPVSSEFTSNRNGVLDCVSELKIDVSSLAYIALYGTLTFSPRYGPSKSADPSTRSLTFSAPLWLALSLSSAIRIAPAAFPRLTRYIPNFSSFSLALFAQVESETSFALTASKCSIELELEDGASSDEGRFFRSLDWK
jgi:hypothetical protein